MEPYNFSDFESMIFLEYSGLRAQAKYKRQAGWKGHMLPIVAHATTYC